MFIPQLHSAYASAHHHGPIQTQSSTPRVGSVVPLVTVCHDVFNTMQAIDPFIANPDFEAKQIEKASKACTAICLWVRAMHKYNTVAKQVEPKRKLLAEKQVHPLLIESARTITVVLAISTLPTCFSPILTRRATYLFCWLSFCCSLIISQSSRF